MGKGCSTPPSPRGHSSQVESPWFSTGQREAGGFKQAPLAMVQVNSHELQPSCSGKSVENMVLRNTEAGESCDQVWGWRRLDLKTIPRFLSAQDIVMGGNSELSGTRGRKQVGGRTLLSDQKALYIIRFMDVLTQRSRMWPTKYRKAVQ